MVIFPEKAMEWHRDELKFFRTPCILSFIGMSG